MVPRPRLRNGRLNQTALSFFLFVRDIAKSDLVQWIDDQLALNVDALKTPSFAAGALKRLIEPLRNVYGISDKILTMTLSSLLLGASANRPHWFEAGKNMIAVDTLVRTHAR